MFFSPFSTNLLVTLFLVKRFLRAQKLFCPKSYVFFIYIYFYKLLAASRAMSLAVRLDAEEEREDVLKRGCGVGKSIEVGVGDMERIAQN